MKKTIQLTTGIKTTFNDKGGRIEVISPYEGCYEYERETTDTIYKREMKNDLKQLFKNIKPVV